MELTDHTIRQSLQSGLTALTWGSTAILITLSGSFATGVQAQPEQQRLTAIEEIVVTARRRDESLQEVPIAITAFDDPVFAVSQYTLLHGLAWSGTLTGNIRRWFQHQYTSGVVARPAPRRSPDNP